MSERKQKDVTRKDTKRRAATFGKGKKKSGLAKVDRSDAGNGNGAVISDSASVSGHNATATLDGLTPVDATIKKNNAKGMDHEYDQPPPKAKIRTHKDAANSDKQRKAVREGEAYGGIDADEFKSSKHMESTWLVKSAEVEGLKRAIERASKGGKIVLMGPAVATGRDWKKHWSTCTELNLDDRWLPYRGSEEIDGKVRKMLEEKNLVLAPSLSEKTIRTVKELGYEVFSLSTPVSHIENATSGEDDVGSRRLAKDQNYRDRSNIMALTKKPGVVAGMMDGTCQKMGDLFRAVKKMEDQRMPSGNEDETTISNLSRHDEQMDETEPAGSADSQKASAKPDSESGVEVKATSAKTGDGNSNN